MIISSEHSVAEDGIEVQSSATLSIEDVGVVRRPFRVTVSVDHVRLFTSHHATEAEAFTSRERMHSAYLATHNGAVRA